MMSLSWSEAILMQKIACAIAMAMPLLAVQVTITNDSYVNSSQPALNFGALPQMAVDSAGNGAALVRFDLPQGTVAAAISKAVLRLWVMRVITPGTVTIQAAAGDWAEGTVNHVNRPAGLPSVFRRTIYLPSLEAPPWRASGCRPMSPASCRHG